MEFLWLSNRSNFVLSVVGHKLSFLRTTCFVQLSNTKYQRLGITRTQSMGPRNYSFEFFYNRFSIFYCFRRISAHVSLTEVVLSDDKRKDWKFSIKNKLFTLIIRFLLVLSSFSPFLIGPRVFLIFFFIFFYSGLF